MYAVGRLGSYISRGVYTVSGSFHPFGGAVDIVVVQQQDGSLKSSPWYVRFGKFQGVLKAKEKVVDINVNGVEADFHMYLDQRGEAYFLREVDSEEAVDAVSSPSSSGEETEGEGCDKRPLKSKSLDYRFDECDSVIDVSNGEVLSMNNSKRSRILEFVLGRKSMKDTSLSKEEVDSDVGRMRSLQRAEIAADLLEMNWSTNLSSRTKIKDYTEANSNYEEITGGKLESSLVLHEQHFVNSLESPGVGESLQIGFNDANKPVTRLITAEEPLKSLDESYTEVSTNQQENASIESVCEAEDDKYRREANETDELRQSLESNSEFQDVSVLTKENPQRLVEEEFIFSDIDDMNSSVNHIHAGCETVDPNYVSDSSPSSFDQEKVKDHREGLRGNIRRVPSNVDICRSRKVTEEEVGRQAKSLPNMWSRLDDYEPNNLDVPQYYSLDSKSRYSKRGLVRTNASRIIEADLEKELQLSDSQSGNALSHDLEDGSTTDSNIVDGSGGSWSLWPFRRSTSKKFSQKDNTFKKDCDNDSGLEANEEKEVSLPKAKKKHVKALIPTSGQLASLKLTEGKNIVTFTFSTSVLGPQKVDARIYLWRWDTRIVISDVDGTITKSDVLGQFMPLVGKDWSHIGVTHLFSAIKENGYQMLFLSARAISQAHITRQFLFNLKQDGKALPDGPVVISPDGLFPSLFREVIRRAPHEFKIACLEDIKACFPSDKNPFYAGFGNRDTDEFSYLKVGIPKGKIFIINPKGEVIVNRSVDSKSYTSLHSLVHGIFPPVSVHEEPEEYNSWNFWKLPPPTVD